MRRLVFLSSLSLLVIAGTLSAQGRGFRGHGDGLGLTEEQRQEMHELVSSLRAEGASLEEIQAAAGELLAEWGIERPDRPGPGFGTPPFLEQLTDEQRAQVLELINNMRAEDATREDIHAAVSELLSSWGVDIPDHPRRGRGLRGAYFFDQLTEDQQQQLQELVSGMRVEGATREEIHEAVAALLEEWGIEPPPGGPGGPEGMRSPKVRIEARNHPNPFNPDTRITYTLSAPAGVNVQLYNLAGQQVRSFEMGNQAAGTYSVRWDGTLANGQMAPTGVYFYRIQADGESLIQRMLLLK